jgi:hypothetical protein
VEVTQLHCHLKTNGYMREMKEGPWKEEDRRGRVWEMGVEWRVCSSIAHLSL